MTKQTKTTDKNIVSRAEFARLQGVGRARISQLANEGRLVLAENGKDVNVLASIALIESTKDLSKIGTIERHAKAREQKKTQNEIQLQNELAELTARFTKLHGEFVIWFEYASKLDGGVYRFLESLCSEPNEHTSELLAAIERKDDDALTRFIYSEFPPEYLECDDDE
jgi:hypothetical protein